MSLFYFMPLKEVYFEKGSNIDIPHFTEIEEWLPKVWDECQMPSKFRGILKKKIKTCSLYCYQQELDGHTRSMARITIEFVSGFHTTPKIREECWKQLEENIRAYFMPRVYHHYIPNGDGWVLEL